MSGQVKLALLTFQKEARSAVANRAVKPLKFFDFSVFFSLQPRGEPFFIRASRKTEMHKQNQQYKH
jgi:hypothetical protein